MILVWVREAFTMLMTFKLHMESLHVAEVEGKLIWHRNTWTKAQSTKPHGVFGKGEGTGVSGTWNMEPGAVTLACSHWVSITEFSVAWGQARDCVLSPSTFSAPGTVPRAWSELCKMFPSEWMSEQKSPRALGTNYTARIVLSTVHTSNNGKLT